MVSRTVFFKDMDVLMIILVFLSNLVVWVLGYAKGYNDAWMKRWK